MDEFDNYLPWTPERLTRVGDDHLKLLLSASPGIKQDCSETINNLAIMLSHRQDLSFNIKTFLGRQALLEWYKNKAYSIYNLDSFFHCIDNRFTIFSDKKLSNGFNLIGYSRGTLGLGEDLRATAALLRDRAIPFSVFHVGHPSDNPKEFFLSEEAYELKYDTSIFFLNVIEAKKFLALYRNYISEFGYKVINPPWELPIAPTDWKPTLAEFDEVWCMSEYVTKAYQGLHVSLINSPPVVEIPSQSNDLSKRQSRVFTFLYIFDAGSYIARKNPEALVRAFLEGFPNSEQAVKLILKVSNWKNNEQTSVLKSLVNLDSRINLVTDNYTQKQMNRLWECCSCYVSLHRSEGFGRTIAEAASRGIPIICTGWSGNVDITGSCYPLLVDYRLKPLLENEYPHSEGQYWAEVDVKDASMKMQWVFSNFQSSKLATIAFGLKQRFNAFFSILSAGRRIEDLYNDLIK